MTVGCRTTQYEIENTAQKTDHLGIFYLRLCGRAAVRGASLSSPDIPVNGAFASGRRRAGVTRVLEFGPTARWASRSQVPKLRSPAALENFTISKKSEARSMRKAPFQRESRRFTALFATLTSRNSGGVPHPRVCWRVNAAQLHTLAHPITPEGRPQAMNSRSYGCGTVNIRPLPALVK